MGIRETDPRSRLSLPPGFRFFPTDQELMLQYLCRKIAGHHFSLQIIGDVDLYKFDAWDLPSKALFGEKEWYFFSPRDRKYPNGSRPNRVAGSGYWKATGTDKVISTEVRKVGIKKSLVFYVGKAAKGTKTNWIMHEYRLFEPPRKNGSTRLDDWVLCRIYKKSSISGVRSNDSSSSSPSQYDDVMDSLPEFDDRFFSAPKTEYSDSVKNIQQEEEEKKAVNLIQHMGSGNFDWATLAGLNPPIQAQYDSRNDNFAPDAIVPNNQRVDNPAEFARDLSNSLDPFRASTTNRGREMGDWEGGFTITWDMGRGRG